MNALTSDRFVIRLPVCKHCGPLFLAYDRDIRIEMPQAFYMCGDGFGF